MSTSPTDLPAFTVVQGDADVLPGPRPRSALLASALRLTQAKIKSRKAGSTSATTAAQWQEDAWDVFDLVGEERFLATTLSNRLSQAKFFVGRVDPEHPDDDPTPLDDKTDPDGVIRGYLDTIGGSITGRQQIMARLALNLFVAGDGWLVGVPPDLMDPDVPNDTLSDTPLLADLDWHMLSVSEVRFTGTDSVTLLFGADTSEQFTVNPDQVWMIRIWRPHPRRSWEADSPTRSSLPVLRELVGLTMHIGAQIDSRLAGAGLFLVPQSAQRAMRVAAGLPAEVDEDDEDLFTEALIEAMVTPIADRASASAVVPLVSTVPDESIEKFRYISFATPLDANAGSMRDEAIRRLALGQDAPPELLLGTGGMNHWGAWLVQEEVVSTHLEPPLALICDAVTDQYLWPLLESQGLERPDAEQYVIWYDVSHLIVRPNRGADAIQLHDRDAISDESLRQATGFDESDAPAADQAANQDDSERAELEQAAGQKALELALADPSLIVDPGLEALAKQVLAILDGSYAKTPTAPPSAGAAPPADGPPTQQDTEPAAAEPDLVGAPA